MTVFHWAITRRGVDELDPAQYWCTDGTWVTDPLKAYIETSRAECEKRYRASSDTGTLRGVKAVKVVKEYPTVEEVLAEQGEVIEAEFAELVPIELDMMRPALIDVDNATLGELIEEANRWFIEAEAHERSAVVAGYRAGRALLAIKEQGKRTGEIPHGKFETWINANFASSYRTARRYMQLAENWSRVQPVLEQGLAVDTVPSINAVLRAITPPKEPRPKPDPVIPKLTKARRSYLLRELDKLRELMGFGWEEDEVEGEVMVRMSQVDHDEWVKVLAEVAEIVTVAEVKR